MSPRRAFVAVCCAVLTAGCAAAGSAKRASPTEWGLSFHAVPALDVGSDENTTLHPTLGYTWLSWDGGHDNMYQFGAQLRRSVVDSPLWYGGEAGYERFSSSYDSGYDSESYNGIRIGVLGGYRLDTDFAPTSVYVALSRIQFFGTTFENFDYEGWGGFHLRFGIDVQPDLFKK